MDKEKDKANTEWLEEYFYPHFLKVSAINVRLKMKKPLTDEQTHYLENLRYVIPVLERLNREAGLTIEKAITYNPNEKKTDVPTTEKIVPVAPQNKTATTTYYPKKEEKSDVPDVDPEGDERVKLLTNLAIQTILTSRNNNWAIYSEVEGDLAASSESEQSEEDSEDIDEDADVSDDENENVSQGSSNEVESVQNSDSEAPELVPSLSQQLSAVSI